MTIRLHNSKTRRKEDFAPLDADNVRMYVCGPTVYDRAHLGNGRAVVVFDVLYRLLRQVYGPDHVTYVRNFTDVDDKINDKAAETGRSIRDITDETIGWFHDDMDALGALRPTVEPRATEFIPQMVAMIEGLVASGHAYAASGHVLFRVRSYAEYGRLSGRSVDDMIAGARVEVSPFKEDPMDFVLWKPSSGEQPGWDSPWGFGRPGWHIECSAMAGELLGESFDIHGGGLDLQFPHHENELAQSSCAHPLGGFAQVWMHNEMLQVEGKKMSKSLGNFFTVREVLDGSAPLSGGAYTGDEIRAAFLLSHYRTPMDFNVIRRHEARTVVKEMSYQLGMRGTDALLALRSDEPLQPLDDVVTALADDMDTAKAIGCLRSKAYRERHTVLEQFGLHQRIYDSQRLLGFDLRLSKEALYAAQDGDARRGALNAAFDELKPILRVQDLINKARSKKDFKRADELRDAVIAAGAEVSITKDGAEIKRLASFDVAKLEALE